MIPRRVTPDLLAFASAEVDAVMPIADSEGPEVMRGLWWMDGNPLPDEVISFHSARWDPSTRCIHVAVGENTWTWHRNAFGRALFRGVRAADLHYELRFDESLSFVEITPRLRGGMRISSRLITLTARRVGEGLWLRHSGLAGRVMHTYALRRIVRADGTREPAFQDYISRAPVTSYLAVR